MKKIATALVAGACMMSVAPAFAQDNSTFTGPRVEGILGYDITKAGSDVDNDFDDNDDESIEGLLYGVGVGYDISVGGAVLGIEGEYTDSTAKTEFTSPADFEGFGLGRVDTGRDLYIGARAGILASSNTLVYIKGGYTNARYNVLASDGDTELRDNIDTDGWRLGAGAEMALNENAFAKLEYRYSHYSKAELDFGDDIPDSDQFNIDTDRHQIVAAVGWRF